MTRTEAIAAVRALARGLPAEGGIESKTSRLMERISAQAAPELLRDALIELGARALLAEKA